jgi:hypothetical protein
MGRRTNFSPDTQHRTLIRPASISQCNFPSLRLWFGRRRVVTGAKSHLKLVPVPARARRSNRYALCHRKKHILGHPIASNHSLHRVHQAVNNPADPGTARAQGKLSWVPANPTPDTSKLVKTRGFPFTETQPRSLFVSWVHMSSRRIVGVIRGRAAKPDIRMPKSTMSLTWGRRRLWLASTVVPVELATEHWARQGVTSEARSGGRLSLAVQAGGTALSLSFAETPGAGPE